MQANCSPAPGHAEVAVDAVAAALSEAGLDDIAIIDTTTLQERQRDCDTLVLATGRTPQHALAGAQVSQLTWT
jgi:ribosomal silencing factor RsfS